MIVTRILEKSEYEEKLKGTELELVWPGFTDDDIAWVVELDGKVIACWSLIRMYHVEGIWIDKAYRKGFLAMRNLFKKLYFICSDRKIKSVVTASVDEEVTSMLLNKLNATELPGRHFTFGIRIKD